MNLHALVVLLRQFRSVHKYIGVTLGVFLLMTAFTGILLGWKKNVEILQPSTQNGSTGDLRHWKSFDEISRAALRAMDSVGNVGPTLDRMDVRPKDGVVKVQFKDGYWEAQIDAGTGKVLSVAQRHADWIEHIHDGSIVNDVFKLGYTNLVGLGLLTLGLSGFWLWGGPKVIRRWKALHKS